MAGFMLAGIMMVLTILIMMARMNLRRWLGYANIVDVMFTIVIIALFHDTFSGVVAASFAGVFMSIMLWVLRCSVGCERLKFVKVPLNKGLCRLRWIEISATECRQRYYPKAWNAKR